MVRQFTASLVADTRCALGESPFWNDSTGELSWLDIEAGTLLRYRDGASVDRSELPHESTFVTLGDAGGTVAAHPEGVDLVTAGGDVHRVAPGWLDTAGERTNDGAIDPAGRIWVGSTTRARAPGSGRIGVVENGTWSNRFEGLTLPNGIGWSPSGETVYYIDTLAGKVRRAAYDATSATVGTSDTLFSMERQEGLLDGLSVDVLGGVWVAVWGGGRVIRIDERGTLAATVTVDTSAVTSCAFVGTSLYITTADPGGSAAAGAGGLSAADVGVEGVPVPVAYP